jgi:hypothetical protein
MMTSAATEGRIVATEGDPGELGHKVTAAKINLAA